MPVTHPWAGNYFVSTYPPFSAWDRSTAARPHPQLERFRADAAGVPLGLYVHIPFCTVRCLYCYYLSSAGRSELEIDSYVDALVREFTLLLDGPGIGEREPEFVYFGGGTPSILSAPQIQKLLCKLKALLPWTSLQEATWEVAPTTVTKGKLDVLRKAGITRISMGIQQLDDDVLKTNGRVHLSQDVDRALKLLRQFDFDVVNLDLIVGLIGESEETFSTSLDRVIGMNPDSVTIYQLEIPENTPLFRLYSEGKLDDVPPSWRLKRARLARGFETLEAAGYQIRSAYTAARPAKNQFVYQDAQYHGADLLGIGASAFSYYSGLHYQNVTSPKEYLNRINRGDQPIERSYSLSPDERLVREFVLQLKLGYVSESDFTKKFGVSIFDRFSDTISDFERRGLLTKSRDDLILTREGLLQVDELLPVFYLPEHQGIRYS